jgi:Mn2+/Fe2+ NRAMP family transporter
VLPQFALGVAAIQQNLLPASNSDPGKWIIGLILFFGAAFIVQMYDRGGSGLKWFERLLKAMVGLIVLSFLGVVLVLAFKGGLDLPSILAGHVPDFSTLFNPTPAFAAAIEQTPHPEQWRQYVVSDQKDKIITAFGTAVGINMTFLLPSSILKRKWGRKARGLALFDLCVGLIIPFVIATGCLVIAAASQFHGKFEDVLQADGTVKAEMKAAYEKPLKAIQDKLGDPEGKSITDADRKIAAMLANRDTKQLASALEPLTGPLLAQKIFGLGVLGMAFSTIIILMLINGFTVCEALNRPDDRKLHFLGALLPGMVGFFAPILWTGDSKTALAVPASVIGGSLIPIAYFTFFLLMNSRKTLGSELPTGFRRIRWNVMMFFATAIATFGSVWVLSGKGLPGMVGIGVLVVLFLLGIAGFLRQQRA